MAEATKSKPKARTRTRKVPEKLVSRNPATGGTLGEIPANSPAEVADLVAHARKVQAEWAAIPAEGRARILSEVRHRIYDRMDDIVETVASECGKPRAEALAHDVLPTVMMLLYFEKAAPRALRPERVGRLLTPLVGTSSRIEWRPFGVVGAITPWNYPITNCFLAFAPALFAGNTVLVKPSEVTPGCGEIVRDLLDPLPAGVATVIQGGGDVGAALVDAPCDKISFIGSPATGRKICEAAAKHLTPVVMELGGNDAAIVCEDADLDAATSGVLWSSFFNAGQTCCSLERAYVVGDIADDFESRLLSKLERVRQGEEVGSLTFAPQLDVVKRHVSDAVRKGARVLGGGPNGGKRNRNGSLWYRPTVLGGVTDEMAVLKEETFGPVLTVVRVRDEDEAVRRANEDGVNLTASVWTTSRRRSNALAAKLRAGTVTANFHGETGASAWGPWGGVGESGFGRLNGRLGIREFTVPTHVATSLTPKMKRLWWYPYDEASTATLRGLSELLSAPKLPAKVDALKRVLANAPKALKNKL
ncbi:MAG: aldehyde dehydrogenase family protein [Actinomycetota bacterium]